VSKRRPQLEAIHHYTNKKGYNAIRAVPVWCFQTGPQRTRAKPYGAYSTTLQPSDPNFVRRVRLPRTKREYRFSFADLNDLTSLLGPGGQFVFYSSTDYYVEQPRQIYSGTA